MECNILINNESIGNTHFQITDASMGAISGDLICTENYRKYQSQIRKHTLEKGNSNLSDFNFRVVTKNKNEILAEGGIAIIDSEEFNELIVECAGVDLSKFEI